ncbi:uncharacterized protein ASCRUDRAFT_28018, partial [Ascoidea rubescens DSM 1968]
MEWIETTSGNRISRKAVILGATNILLAGNTTIAASVSLNGDVRLNSASNKISIQIGKHSLIGPSSEIWPPIIGFKRTKTKAKRVHGTSKIGSFTIISKNCVVKSINIGNRVLIEKNCYIGNLSIVYDNVVIKKNSCIPDKFIIPPFSYVYGKPPNLVVESLPVSFKNIIERKAREL